MMQKKKIAVIFGGCSNEYEISLESAHAVITHFDKDKYEVLPLGITQEGKWYHFYGDYSKIADNTWCNEKDCRSAFISPDRGLQGIIVLDTAAEGKGWQLEKIDIAFPVLHGKNGEDGTVQGLLELSGIPFIGCGMLGSAVGMDKDIAHIVAAAAGVQVPAAVVLDEGEWRQSGSNILSKAEKLKYPLFVKPVRAGSSFGISRAEREEELEKAVKEAFLVDNKVIIEEEIKGFEVGCAVMGNHELTVGTVDEIELSGSFFDYEEKYHRQTAQVYMPARIDSEVAERIRETAQVIYRALDCRGFTRVDMFLTPDKEIVFNEVNTIPGLTSTSRFPTMLSGIGISFEKMLDMLVDLAEEPIKSEV